MMFKRIAVLAALAAGTVLLTACNATESVSGAGQGNSAGVAADVKLAAGADDESVDCGEVEVDGNTHTLTAEPTAGGIVGCTEAFNVLDEYLTHGTSIEDTMLSNGWSCVTDDGETAAIGCLNDSGLAFSTTPSSTDGDGQPVDCGEVEVEGTTHTLTAEPTFSGVVGCTEAFNVLDVYLAIPVEDRGAGFENLPLSNGWACGTDDGEVMSIGCVKGGLDNDYKLAFHTMPV
jgi:predicted small secreted protein